MQPNPVPLDARRFEGYAGISLWADVGGDVNAPPVILMHGGGQTRHAWAEAATALVDDGFHVVSLDLRGHGEVTGRATATTDWMPSSPISKR
jgi:non-heme chloroperoxidase